MTTSAHDVGPIDVTERGAPVNGQPQTMDRRLFMQLLVCEAERELGIADATKNLKAALERRKASCVVYADVNNPFGLGILSWSEDAGDFVSKIRPVFQEPELHGLRLRHDFTMLG